MPETTNECTTRELRELSLLLEISTALNKTLDLKIVLGPVLQKMAEHMDMHRGTLTMINRKTDEIVIEESFGLSPQERARGIYRRGEGVTGTVVETGEPVVIPRISEDPLFLDRTGSRRQLKKKEISFICVPIKIGSEVIGTLSVDRLYNDGIVLDDDVRLLTIVASIIARAVQLRQQANEEIEKLRDENRRLHEELKLKYHPPGVIGTSKGIQEVYKLIGQVCNTGTTVLILGESGVGKEKIAEAIHYNSHRSDKPFIAVNCAALPENLIESELFGYERGAFTGAMSMRKGRFEIADGGTLFLDEIGELPMAMQTKLLRVIQEKKFERIGGNNSLKVDVRIIAATNRNLEKSIAEGSFREDLFYRLNVFPIIVPPLRERSTDIMLLAEHFIEKYSRDLSREIKRISTPAIDMLVAYHWPGNVRELENCMERAVILSTDGVIHSYHLPPSLQMSNGVKNDTTGSLQEMTETIEKELIIEELKLSRGKMAQAARELGITERIMGLRVKKYGIDPRRFR